MSVIGQIESLTHLLMRARSFQVLGVRTTSRASSGLVSHSGAYSTQKSIQPMGGRVGAPMVMKSCWSLDAFAVGVASPATMRIAVAKADANTLVQLTCIPWPLPC